VSVYKNWMKLLNWVIKHHGGYYHKWVKSDVTDCYINRNCTSLRTFWLPIHPWQTELAFDCTAHESPPSLARITGLEPLIEDVLHLTPK
jgi:hypothetical protein